MKSVVGMIVVFIGLYIIAYSDIMDFCAKTLYYTALGCVCIALAMAAAFWVRLLPNRYLRDEVTTMIKLLTSVKRFLPQWGNKRLLYTSAANCLVWAAFF